VESRGCEENGVETCDEAVEFPVVAESPALIAMIESEVLLPFVGVEAPEAGLEPVVGGVFDTELGVRDGDVLRPLTGVGDAIVRFVDAQ
jgi:hypothetical protein